MAHKPLTYRAAGVDIDAGDELVQRIKPAAKRTHREGVLSGLGGFGGLFEIPAGRFKNPVLVSGTDGVGTKLKLAIEHDAHDTIGIDLVAMCVNDIVVTGAEPLFFLDYYATGKLKPDVAARVVEGIADGCELAGAALIGGETAEMPGMYAADDYDLAGFAVGIVEKENILDGSRVAAGDVLLGLASSGPHSNGYSLIRKIIEQSGVSIAATKLGEQHLLQAVMAPTRIYVKPLLGVFAAHTVHGLAHITGGGITENLPRIIPNGLGAEIDLAAWEFPPVFDWLAEHGNVERKEMLRTFNCGIGMVLCVPEDQAAAVTTSLAAAGESAVPIGHIVAGSAGVNYLS